MIIGKAKREKVIEVTIDLNKVFRYMENENNSLFAKQKYNIKRLMDYGKELKFNPEWCINCIENKSGKKESNLIYISEDGEREVFLKRFGTLYFRNIELDNPYDLDMFPFAAKHEVLIESLAYQWATSIDKNLANFLIEKGMLEEDKKKMGVPAL